MPRTYREVADEVSVMLNAPAVAPECYGEPELVEPCRGCGLRLRCFDRAAKSAEVYLLPRAKREK